MKQLFLFIVMSFCSFVCYGQTTYVYNLSKNEVVIDENSLQVRAIASITKLMTAVVVLDSGVSLEEKVPTKNVFFFKKNATREELMTLMLVKSDNAAAESLAVNHPGGRSEFIETMNRKSKFLGMNDTAFDDASGLSAKNISTSRDLTVLLTYAFGMDKIKQMSSTLKYNISIPNNKKTQVYGINNTNYRLLELFNTEILISKTGTTTAAGKCLALFTLKNEEKYVMIFLGYNDRKKIEDRVKDIFKYNI
jgi:serine-type D-Ala-D-Ala endopeptidase (penicillin-binding protein 7)